MDPTINIHRVEAEIDLDQVALANPHTGNAVLSTEDHLQAAAQLLEALRTLPDGQALVIWRGWTPA